METETKSKMSRLEDLPDHILSNNILPLLWVDEAARTSILARRWRFLWLGTPNLEFNSKALVGHGCHGQPEFGKDKYVELVDRVIFGYERRAALRLFQLQFPLPFLRRSDESFSRKVASWIKFSLGKGVEVLDVTCHSHGPPHELAPYSLCLSSIQPQMFPNIRLLKSLTLEDVPLSNESLEDFLLGCELLETLQLRCIAPLTRVNVTGTLSRLKSIYVSRTSSLEAIMIFAPTPDLVTFIYPVRIVKQLHIEHAPCLVDMSIAETAEDFCLISHPLFPYLSQLEALHLYLRCWDMVIHWLPHLPDLSRLKHLELKIAGFEDPSKSACHGRRLHGLASLIKAAPCLQHLTLNAPTYPGVTLNVAEEFANLHLPNLRVIEILECSGGMFECVLALHLIKAAVSLEKLIIHCGVPMPEEWPQRFSNISGSTTQEWNECAKEVFGLELPSKAKLVLMYS